MSKIILDLCGGSGSWSRYYAQNGYDVRIITLPEFDVAYLHKSAIAMIPQLQFANPKTDGDFRSITSPAFALAFFNANR